MSELVSEQRPEDTAFERQPLVRRAIAEAIGTFILVFGGVGAIVASNGELDTVGISLAFGLALLAGIAAVDHISDAHFNPAVTIGLTAIGRFKPADVPVYIAAQLIGAIAAAGLLAGIFPDWTDAPLLAGQNAPAEGVSNISALLLEITLTAVFVFVIASVESRVSKGATYAPLIIALTLVLAHLVAVSVTGCSVNPARTLGPDIVGGSFTGWWIFVIGPVAGGLLGAGAYRFLAPHVYSK